MYSFCQHKFTDEQKSFVSFTQQQPSADALYSNIAIHYNRGLKLKLWATVGTVISSEGHSKRNTQENTHKYFQKSVFFFFLNFKYCIRQNCKRECSFSPQILSNKKSNFKIYIRAVSRGGRKFHTPALSFT